MTRPGQPGLELLDPALQLVDEITEPVSRLHRRRAEDACQPVLANDPPLRCPIRPAEGARPERFAEERYDFVVGAAPTRLDTGTRRTPRRQLGVERPRGGLVGSASAVPAVLTRAASSARAAGRTTSRLASS